MGFLWNSTNANLDAGIDGIIEIRDPVSEEVSNCILQVQVKAISGKLTNESNNSFTYLCNERDIDYWLKGNVPVLLVVVRLDSGEAFWADIKDVFSDLSLRAERFITIDKSTHKFDASAAPHLLKLAVPKHVGSYMPAAMQEEELISNLLEVTGFPPSIYVASTDHRDVKDIFEWAREQNISLQSGWVLTNGTIRGIYDLRSAPWRELCDLGTVESFDISEWAESDDVIRLREFVWIMNSVLKEDMRLRGIHRSTKEDCFFFPADRREVARTYSYQSIAKKTSREVVKAIRSKKSNTFQCFRHAALKHSFVRLSGIWYLRIIPHYIYTLDNKKLYPFAEEQLSGIKKLEHQNAVLGQTIMWSKKLTESSGLFDKGVPSITFGDLLKVKCPRSIDDEIWRRGDASDGRSFSDESEEWGLF